MSANRTLDRPYPPLLDWLKSQDVDYEIHEHEPAFTARATATAEGVDPRTFAKVVGLAPHDGPYILIVLDATDQLDLHKSRRALGAGDVRLLTEAELTALAPGCEVGAIPAVGTRRSASTRAATASALASSGRPASAPCGVIYADFAVDDDTRPAWARS